MESLKDYLGFRKYIDDQIKAGLRCREGYAAPQHPQFCTCHDLTRDDEGPK